MAGRAIRSPVRHRSRPPRRSRFRRRRARPGRGRRRVSLRQREGRQVEAVVAGALELRQRRSSRFGQAVLADPYRRVDARGVESRDRPARAAPVAATRAGCGRSSRATSRSIAARSALLHRRQRRPGGGIVDDRRVVLRGRFWRSARVAGPRRRPARLDLPMRGQAGSANKPSASAGSGGRAELNTASNGLAAPRSPKLGGASGDRIGASPPTAAEDRTRQSVCPGEARGQRDARPCLAAGAAPVSASNALIVRSASRRAASPIRSVPFEANIFPIDNPPTLRLHYAAASPSMSSAIPMSFILR